MKRSLALSFAALTLLLPTIAWSKDAADKGKADKPKDPLASETFSGIKLREIGPAVTSGRIVDVAVNPQDPSVRYVASASGGVWKTTNAGISWTPIFDGQGSYSIGCLAIDPVNPLTVWVGTGENNSQRSVSYGDGLYKSVDGGATWKKVGLEKSEHIGKITIDPTNTSRVFVAAQGPLWSDGGDRGVYRTTDGGATWKQVLKISEHTGVNEVVMDPRDPNTLYASAYQRRRHVWTLIDGGPESTIYKSTDGGDNWKKVEKGLPDGDKGRIGLAVSPVNPDIVYAWVEAKRGDSGFFRSSNRGESWEKRGSFISTSPQYYSEIIPDPKQLDRVYAMDTFMAVTDDGGKTWQHGLEKSKHVDNHALWIDPADTNHLINGNDGGLYESFDRGQSWRFTTNLPVTQFYRVDASEDTPFYNVYGGTQDNFSLGGPARTLDTNGIVSSDWFVTHGGDGFKSVADYEDPSIVYAEAQNGDLVRFDRKSGEEADVQPQPGPGEPPNRWNWDSALILSPHSHTRLYFGAQRLFKSDDRGNTWVAVSPDLTRQIDRNKLKVMGRVWGIDAVAKNASTALWGNIVAISESPLAEGVLYVGTDDGVLAVSEDGGANWRKITNFPGVPDMTYVSDVEASQSDKNTVYATFDNHQMGDFKPYVFKSADRGHTWTSIAGELPARGTVYAIDQDNVQPSLLFAGTEFGLFFSPDEGKKWIQLKGGGFPTIAVRDLDIQRREGDLAIATFGRGYWILDDYSPLRLANHEALDKSSALLQVKPALAYVERRPIGLRGKGFQGESFYTASNPPFGAVFTYYLKEGLKSLKEERQEKESKLVEKNEDVSYPTWDELRAEERAEDPTILLTVTDEQGNVVRRVTGPASSGFHRVAWDLRYPSSRPVSVQRGGGGDEPDIFDNSARGPLAAPGNYRVQLAQRVNGVVTPLGEALTFEVKPLENASLAAKDRVALLAFQRQTAELQRAVLGAQNAADEANDRLDALARAIADTPRADVALRQKAIDLDHRIADLQIELEGDPTIARRNEGTPPAIVDRVERVAGASWTSTSEVTATQRRDYEIAAQQFGAFLPRLQQALTDLEALEKQAEELGAPWTPGRVPTWKGQQQ